MAEELGAAKKDLSVLRIQREPERASSSALTWTFGAVGLLALGAAGFLGWQWRQASRPVEVETGVVRAEASETATVLLNARGYIEPDRKSELSCTSYGIIEKIHFRETDDVAEGMILAELQNDDLEELVKEAEIVLKHAKIELDRQISLWNSDKATTEREVQNARRDFEVAERKLAYATKLYEKTLIRAPFAGKITRRTGNVGDTIGSQVGQGNSIGTLVDFSSLLLVADVNQSDVARLEGVEKAEIQIDGVDRKYAGRILWIVPTADRVKGIVQVKVSIDDRDDKVRPQMSARVTFYGKSGKGRRIVVPDGAERNGSVLVVRDGKVERVDVTALRGGEEVVLKPELVLEGRPVKRKE